MKLLDSEIRDIQKFLEAGKPLSEKYRFLLFEDKKERGSFRAYHQSLFQ